MTGDYAVVLLVAAASTWLATWAWRTFASRRPSLIDVPSDRRVHTRPTPKGGGIAMWAAFVVALGVAWRLPGLHEVFGGGSEPLGVLVGATIMLAIGLIDDIRDMSPPAKIAGTVLAASIMASQGVQMIYFRVPFWDVVVLDPSTGYLVTILWVMVVTEAVNLIDGLDGLAAGISLIAGAAFFLYAQRQVSAGLLTGDSIGPLLAVIVVGVCLGFLPHNAHPAKVFMGDAGAFFLGLLLATSTLVVGGRTNDEFSGQTFFFFAPILIPFVILGVPLLDTGFAFLRRVVRRKGWSVADKEHLHHRLLRIGHGQRRAVVILWAWTAILATVALVPSYTNRGNALVLPMLLALGLLLFTVLHPEVRERRRSPVEVTVDEAPSAAQVPSSAPTGAAQGNPAGTP